MHPLARSGRIAGCANFGACVNAWHQIVAGGIAALLRYICIVVGLLLAAILAVGFSLRWDALSALNLADRLWLGQGGRLVAAGQAYGSDPAQAIDIYAPDDAARDARLPVILWYNGGGWASGTRTQYGFVGRALSAEGFLVAVVNYRHAPQHKFPPSLRIRAMRCAGCARMPPAMAVIPTEWC